MFPRAALMFSMRGTIFQRAADSAPWRRESGLWKLVHKLTEMWDFIMEGKKMSALTFWTLPRFTNSGLREKKVRRQWTLLLESIAAAEEEEEEQ